MKGANVVPPDSFFATGFGLHLFSLVENAKKQYEHASCLGWRRVF